MIGNCIKKILNFDTISSHSGNSLVLENCLEDCDLASKLYTITVDNARGNNSTCTTLIDDFKRHGVIFFSLAGNCYMMHCSHT